jgi:hypothetical protein
VPYHTLGFVAKAGTAKEEEEKEREGEGEREREREREREKREESAAPCLLAPCPLRHNLRRHLHVPTKLGLRDRQGCGRPSHLNGTRHEHGIIDGLLPLLGLQWGRER